MTLDDSSLMERAKRASAEGLVLRGAAAKEALAEATYGADVSALVSAAAQEDPQVAAEAFAELVDRFYPRILGICYSFFQNSDKASELAHAVCGKIWDKRVKLDSSRKFEAYLVRVVTNFCIDRWRQENRRGSLGWDRVVSLDAPASSGESEGQPLVELVADPDTLEWEQRLQLKEVVERVLSRLSGVHRFVLLMRCREQLTLAEIGDKLGCTAENVGYHERKAEMLFRNYFSEEWNQV